MTVPHEPTAPDDALRRWRLILGRYAARPMGGVGMQSDDWKLDQALEYLYGREFDGRGLAKPAGGPGSLDPTQLRAIDWLNRSRKLFPQEVFERMQTQAIDRYQLFNYSISGNDHAGDE